MEEPRVTNLTMEDVSELLGVQTFTGEPRQIEKLRKWIEKLVQTRGRAYVREFRLELLSEWEQCAKPMFKTCL